MAHCPRRTPFTCCHVSSSLLNTKTSQMCERRPHATSHSCSHLSPSTFASFTCAARSPSTLNHSDELFVPALVARISVTRSLSSNRARPRQSFGVWRILWRLEKEESKVDLDRPRRRSSGTTPTGRQYDRALSVGLASMMSWNLTLPGAWLDSGVWKWRKQLRRGGGGGEIAADVVE